MTSRTPVRCWSRQGSIAFSTTGNVAESRKLITSCRLCGKEVSAVGCQIGYREDKIAFFHRMIAPLPAEERETGKPVSEPGRGQAGIDRPRRRRGRAGGSH